MNLNTVDISKLPADIRKTYRQLQVLHAEKKIQNRARTDFLSFVKCVWPDFIEGPHHKIVANKFIDKVFTLLKEKNLLYEGITQPPKGSKKEEWKEKKHILFKSKDFGDDKDRALQKSDQSWTYFASDVAYHNNKLDRKYDVLINILGADHAGYIKRINAGVEALSNKKTKLNCKVSQLVKLLKDGKPFKMSKRKGDYITVEDLIKEVGKDSTRFMMLSRSNDVEIDFDFKKVTEKSKDNPVFYVQYAYARINSIFRVLKLNIEDDIKFTNEDFTLNYYEIEILKKISEWPKCVELSSTRLEPHRIPFYLYELVSLFHSYWNLGKDNKEFRFISEKFCSILMEFSLKFIIILLIN